MRALTTDELAALADGTLAPKRREVLLRFVSASPELAIELALQMTAVGALRGLDTPAPAELRERIERAIQDHEQPDQGRQVT